MTLLDRCSDAEYSRRHGALREDMRAEGLVALLVYGNAGAWQNVFYLANHYQDLVGCFLLLPLDSDPVLFTGLWGYLEASRQHASVKDVRFGGASLVASVAQELTRRGLDSGSIGLVEADTFRMPGLPHKNMIELKRELPSAEIVSATHMVQTLRKQKSQEEIDFLRHGAELSDKALLRGLAAIRPSATEFQVAQAMAAAEGVTQTVLIGSTSMEAPRALTMPTSRPTSRELRRGDVILIELSKGVTVGYAGQVHVMATLGPPNGLFSEMHEQAWDAFRNITEVLRTGCNSEDVVTAGDNISKAGYFTGNPLVHGWGLSVEPGFHVGAREHPIRPAEIVRDLGAALTGRLSHDDLTRYNAAQKVLYLGILLTGAVIVASGLAIWKPVQLRELTALFGGYDGARLVHFFAMVTIVLFLVVHIGMSLLVPKTLRAMISGR
jgi:Xaa-Pro aminopeptidase